MGIYGGFEPRRPHTLGALASVYEARAQSGSPAGRFALKIFHPPSSTQVKRWLALEGFLLAAEWQQKAGVSGAGVPVREFGRCAEGVFSVQDWCDTPFEPIADALPARGDQLRVVASKILDALKRWHDATGRAHGKLRASNVFLEGTGPLGARTFRLSDPWFVPGVKDAVLRRRELGELGAILVRIVRRRAAGGWPIEDAPEWRALGRAGEAWREYCNLLLNPAADAALTTDEALLALRKIPTDAKPARTAALATAATLAVGALGVTGYARFAPLPALPRNMLPLAEWVGNPAAFRTEVSKEWAQLCRAWSTWVGDVFRNGERWERTEGLWTSADDELRAAFASFRVDGAGLDPRVLVPEAAGNSLGVLADSPPEAVRSQLLRSSVDLRVQAAWQRVADMARQMDAWTRWQEIELTATQLEARRLGRAAASLRQRLAPGAEDPTTTAAIRLQAFNTLSQDRDGALLLLPRWRRIEELAAECAASRDRVQAAIPSLVLGRITDRASLGDFADALGEPLAELQRRRQQFLNPEVSRERFLNESGLLRDTAPVTEATVEAWEKELVAFSRVSRAEDPRAATDWADRFSRLEQTAVDLEDEAPAAEGGPPPLARAELLSSVAGLRANVDTLQKREVLRVDIQNVDTEVRALGTAAQTLEERVEATLALLKPELWLRRVADRTWSFPSLQEQWNRWRERDLREVSAAALEADRNRFRQLREVERRVRGWLQELEGANGLGRFEAPEVGGARRSLRVALLEWERRRRDALGREALRVAAWQEERPVSAWTVVADEPAVRAAFARHRLWVASVPDIASDLEALADRLSGGYGWTEGIAELAARLGTRNDLGEITDEPQEWLRQMAQLAATQGAATREELVSAARGEGLSLQLTAWRRLGTLSGWPASIQDLEIDGELVAGIRGRVDDSVKAATMTETRLRQLQDEISGETRRRWNRAARQLAADEAQLTQVFARMDRFGISPDDLDAPVAYNLRLWQLKTTEWSNLDLDEVRAQRDAFVTAAGALPEVNANAGVAPFLSALRDLPLKDDPNRPASRSPGRAGWTELVQEGGRRLRVVWTGGSRKVELEYELVQPTDGTLPFYLARRTIAVGEFIDLINGRPEGGAILEAMPAWVRRGGDASEPFSAPLAWRPRPDRRGLELNPTWIYRPDAQVASLLDPTNGALSPSLELMLRERPTVRSPLQRISPDLARLFADRVLGARLPTPQEWTALLTLVGEQKAINVRDRRFAEVWTYLEGYRAANQTIAWRPNQGIFLPIQAVQEGGRTRRMPLRDDGRVALDQDDGALWPGSVDEEPDTAGFYQLLGNLWIYLQEPGGNQYFVAGGSALSPAGLDPRGVFPVEGIPLIGRSRGRTLVDGFSDVGLRPAFDAPPGLRDRFEMLRLVRAQQFLTL